MLAAFREVECMCVCVCVCVCVCAYVCVCVLCRVVLRCVLLVRPFVTTTPVASESTWRSCSSRVAELLVSLAVLSVSIYHAHLPASCLSLSIHPSIYLSLSLSIHLSIYLCLSCVVVLLLVVLWSSLQLRKSLIICSRSPEWWRRYRTAPHSTAQHRTAPHSTAQHNTTQHTTAPHCYNFLFGFRTFSN